jgi:phosphotriesterase-related protein
MAKVRTVLGDISPADLGVTLTHEHVLIDLSFICDVMAPQEDSLKGMMTKPVTMEMMTLLRRGVRKFNYDDALLGDAEVAANEVREYLKFGGTSIIDHSLPGIGRDPVGLARVSRATGANIVCSTGWYMVASHPSYVRSKTPDELAEIMVGELEAGVGDTGVRAGVIGECACSSPIPFHPEEKKVLTAACRAQKRTGVGFSCHPAYADAKNKRYELDSPFAYIELIESEGADLEKFFLSHSDVICHPAFLKDPVGHASRLIDHGITLNFDTFGQDHFDDFVFMGARHPSDSERMSVIVELCNRGHEKNIMISQDVCWKHMLKKYGGAGYSHTMEHILPTLRYHGVTEKQIRTMTVDNPKRILSF